MSAISKTMVAALAGATLTTGAVVAGLALTGSTASAHATAATQPLAKSNAAAPAVTASTKVKKFVAYGPIRGKQRVTGTITLGKRNQFAAYAYNGLWSPKHTNRTMTVKFTLTTVEHGKVKVLHFGDAVTQDYWFGRSDISIIKKLTVQASYGGHYGKKVTVVL
jgi:hypothetical protein